MIAINAKAAFKHPRTGLEEYTYQLLLHLIAQAKSEGLEKHLLLYSPTWANIPQEFLSLAIKVIHAPYLWSQVRLGAQLMWDEPHIFFNTEQLLPYGAPAHSIVTVHDVAYEIYPRFYPFWQQRYLRLVTHRAVRRAKKIIAVSERTKRDISKYYGVPQRKIEVIYHGFTKRTIAHQSDSLENIAPHSLPTKHPYFLYIGRMERKKNVIGIIEAFEIFRNMTKKDIDLVLAGPPGFGSEEIAAAIGRSPMREHIFALGYINDAYKEQLYTNAQALLFVSFYEGFGLPILEAQSLGLPVIASHTSSFPEITGQGGLLVDPQSSQGIAEAMREITANKKTTAYIIKKGYDNVERFSWTKSAKETLAILLSL